MPQTEGKHGLKHKQQNYPRAPESQLRTAAEDLAPLDSSFSQDHDELAQRVPAGLLWETIFRDNTWKNRFKVMASGGRFHIPSRDPCSHLPECLQAGWRGSREWN